MKFTSFLPGIIWLIISTILLALPGNDLPHIRLLDFDNSDKLIHVGMFALLSGLFCYPFAWSGFSNAIIKSRLLGIAFYTLAYGIAMEFVQKYFVAGRSFDLIDIFCDAVGSFAGMLVMLQLYRKKIGPDGNRGRNQN